MAANPHIDDHLAKDKTLVPPPQKSHAGFLIILVVVLIVLGAGIFWEMGQRKKDALDVATGTLDESNRTPTVLVTAVHTAPSAATIELSGQTQPLVETSLYARADGYIKER